MLYINTLAESFWILMEEGDKKDRQHDKWEKDKKWITL